MKESFVGEGSGSFADVTSGSDLYEWLRGPMVDKFYADGVSVDKYVDRMTDVLFLAHESYVCGGSAQAHAVQSRVELM